jgi:hypothetical protein
VLISKSGQGHSFYRKQFRQNGAIDSHEQRGMSAIRLMGKLALIPTSR